jgi:hypothetical protein
MSPEALALLLEVSATAAGQLQHQINQLTH